MSNVTVTVVDGNNVNLEVVPQPNVLVTIDRGIAGPPGPPGSGDVNGPSSSTDNAVARFDGTTGKLIQNSTVLIDDSGNITQPLSVTMANGAGTTVAAGRMWYDGTTGSWNLGMGNGNITQQVGEELFVYGKASAAITDSPLQIVYQTGTVGASGVITFAPTVAGITNGDLILGAATESLAHNAFGRITSFGVIHGITTNGTAYGETWADGDTIWYNPVTGNPTNVKPVAPNIKVSIGTLIKAGNGGSGSIQIEVNHGSVLGGTDSNVQITSAANGNLLTYDATAGYWKNSNTLPGSYTLSGGTANGVAYLNGSKVLTTGSALTFDGSSLGVGIATPTFADGKGIHINNATGSARLHLTTQTTGSASTDGSEFTVAGSDLYIINNESAATIFYNAGSEQMRLTSTGLTTVKDATIQGVTVGRGAGAVSTNTAVGASALAVNTSGTTNTAVGAGAVYVSTGSGNTGVGYAALSGNAASASTASNNTALGYASLYVNTTGANNTALGASALYSNTTGSYSTAVGYQAGYANTTGRSTAFGTQALYSNTTGNYNTAIGDNALASNTTADDNTAVGYQAGAGNVTGTANVFVGKRAGYNATGGYGVSIGFEAGYNNTDITNGNIFVGYYAGRSNTSGSGILAVGTAALTANTTGNYNTAVGRALIANTTGTYNTALGYQSLTANTTANANTAVGYLAANANTTGGGNTAVGCFALPSNTTADGNTAIGYSAGYYNSTGAANVAIGYQSLYYNTTANYNTAVGYTAMYSNTTGYYNTAVGRTALYANTTGAANVALGYSALAANTTGGNNTAIGMLAAVSTTTGGSNTAVGRDALYSNTTANNNTAVGYQAGYYNTTGAYNTFFGQAAGYSTTGGLNTFLGPNAGYYMTSGSKNTIIGAYGGNQGGLDIRTASNYIVLSDGDGNPRFHFNGTTWFTFTLGAGAGTNALKFNTTTGAWTYDTSSARYKDNIRDSIYGLSHVMQMRSAQFEYKDTGRSDVGLIAEELDQIIPELVMKNKDGQPDSVSYDRMVSVLVKAIQELKADLDATKAELAALKGN